MTDPIVLDLDWQQGDKLHSARLTLDGSPITIGRDPSNLLVLNDISVSRHHAEVFLTTQGLMLRDKNSRFGTQLDQQFLSPEHSLLIPPHCELLFGRQKVTLRYEAAQHHEQDFAVWALHDLQHRIDAMQQHSLGALLQLSQQSQPLAELQQQLCQQFQHLQLAAQQWSAQNSLLQRLNTLVNQTQDYQVLLAHAVPMIAQVLGARRGFVLMADKRGQKLQLQACWNYTPQQGPTLSAAEQIARDSFERKELCVLTARQLQKVTPSSTDGAMTGVLAMPLHADGETLALLYLDTTHADGFNQLQETFCKTLQAQLGLALKNAITISRALSDDLTGLCSRSMIEEQITLSMEQAKRYGQPCSLIFIDLDNFKQINDQYGHFAGDEVLRSVAALLKTLARKADRVGRLGGEEFVVLVNNTEADSALVYAERIRADISALNPVVAGVALKVTASIGVAGFHHALQNLAYRFIDCADQAMYQAKNGGKNRVCAHQPATLQLLDTANDALRSNSRG
jgi:diguanylate cyclase (GGDEF)-like protein